MEITETITHFFKWDCSDPGFRGIDAISELEQFIKKIVRVKGRPYVLSNAGVTLNYIHGNAQTIEDNWENNIYVIIEHKGIALFIIVQHEECFAYELLYGRLSPKIEYKKQIEDMKKAREILKNKFPNMQVILIYGHMADRKKRKFVFSQII